MEEEFRKELMEDVMWTLKGCDLAPSSGRKIKVLVPLENCNESSEKMKRPVHFPPGIPKD